jgi:hypothetical protein
VPPDELAQGSLGQPQLGGDFGVDPEPLPGMADGNRGRERQGKLFHSRHVLGYRVAK